MDGTGPRQLLTDSALDRELTETLGIQPSPEFLARVRTRVAAEPARAPWRLVFEPLAPVAIVGIVLALVVPKLMRDEPIQTVNPPRMANVVPDIPRAVAAVVSVRDGDRRTVPAQRASARTTPLRLSPVLVAEDERRAFELFVAAVGQGHVPEAAIEPAVNGREMAELSIAPLVITPLPPLARAGQEGEGQWE